MKTKTLCKWVRENWGYAAGYLIVYAAILLSLNAGMQKQDAISDIESAEAHTIMTGVSE